MTLPAPLPPRSALRAGRPAARALLLAAGLLTAAGNPALAQASGKPSGSGKSADSVCSSYGPGFQRVPGTDSCIRSGATVRTDVYGGTTMGNAPNQFNNNVTPPPATGAATSATDPWKSAR